MHIGASIMYEMRRFYPRASPLERSLLLAGAAAGLSGALNTPRRHRLCDRGSRAQLRIAHRRYLDRRDCLSGLVSMALAGNYLYSGQISAPAQLTLSFVLPVGFAALLCGVGGGCLRICCCCARSAQIAAGLLESRPAGRWSGDRLGLLIALIGLATGGAIWGGGYAQARALLMDEPETVGVFYPLFKMATMVLTYLSGIPRVCFTLAVNRSRFWPCRRHLVPERAGLGIDRGMSLVGYLAAMTQSPLTAFIIVMEMTDGGSLLLPLMATALVSSQVAKLFTPPLYEALALQNYSPAKQLRRPTADGANGWSQTTSGSSSMASHCSSSICSWPRQ